MIEVFHIGEKDSIESVVSDGLKTLKQLAEEGVINLQETTKRKCINAFLPEDLFDFRISTLYFRLEEPPKHCPWVSILVDEHNVNVVNNHLELKGANTYLSSRMPLSTFIERSEGKIEELHPITAIPMDDTIIMNGKLPDDRTYIPEVIIEKPHIPEFHRVNLGF